MLLRELKEVLNSLPEELDEYELVYGEVEAIKGSLSISRRDVPLHDIAIDSDNEKILIAKQGTIEVFEEIESVEND